MTMTGTSSNASMIQLTNNRATAFSVEPLNIKTCVSCEMAEGGDFNKD
jgi:hypothetical protein